MQNFNEPSLQVAEQFDMHSNLHAIFGGLLRALRDNGHMSLHTALARQKDIEFTNDYIIVHCDNLSAFQLFSQNLELIKKFVPRDTIKFSRKQFDVDAPEIVDALIKMFGDKITIL